MNKKSPRNRLPDSFRVERLESRVMLSADPVLAPLAIALMPHSTHLAGTSHTTADPAAVLKFAHHAGASHVLFDASAIDDHHYVLHPAQAVAAHAVSAGSVTATVHAVTPASTFSSAQTASAATAVAAKATVQSVPLVAAASTSLASQPGRVHILTADPASTTTLQANMTVSGNYVSAGGSVKLDLSPSLTFTLNPSSTVALGNSTGFVFATTTNQDFSILPNAVGTTTVSMAATLAGLQLNGYDAIHNLTIGSALYPVTNVSFGGAVNLTGTLTIYATGTVSFGGAVSITNNASLKIFNANNVTFGGAVSLNNQDGTSTTSGTTVSGTAGDIYIQSDSISFTNITSSFTGSGKLTLLPTTALRPVLFASPTGVSAPNSLVIDNSAIASWGSTFSAISIGAYSGIHADAVNAGPVSIGATSNYGVAGGPTVQNPITFYGSSIAVVAAPPATGTQFTFYGNGNVGFDAVNNITFANTVIASTSSTVAQNITAYSASGAITESGGGIYLSAASLTATSATGMTLPGTEIGSLTAVNTGTTGAIAVTQDVTGGALSVTQAAQSNAAGIGGITITTSSGNLTVSSSGQGVVDSGTGAISLTAQGTSALLSVQQVVTSHAGAITMSAPGVLTIGAVTSTSSAGAGVSLTSINAAININANVLAFGGALALSAFTDINMAAGTLLSSVGGNTGAVTLIAGGNDVLATLAAGAAMAVTAQAGSITTILQESGSAAQLNLSGSTANATLTSARGIGARGHDIQTQLSELTLTNSTSGDVFINQTQTGTLQLGTASGNAVTLGGGTGTASIVTTDGGITVNRPITASGGTAGSNGYVLLQSSKVAASSADIIVNANVSTATGSIEIKSAGTLDVGLAAAITLSANAVGQTVYLQAAANVVFLGTSQVNAAGDIWIYAVGGHVTLGQVTSTSGIVAVDAGDAITDGQSNGSQVFANVTAANVRLSSVTGIGTSSNSVELANGASGLTLAGVSSNGGMYVLSQSNLTVGSVGATPVYVTGPATPTSAGDAGTLASVAVYGASNLVLKSNADLTVANAIGLAGPVLVGTLVSTQVRLDATGQLNVNAAIGNIGGAYTTYTGNMSLLGSGGVSVAPTVLVNTLAGTLDVESAAGSVQMGAASFLNSTSGAIRVAAAQNIGVAKIRTTDNVALTASAGSITDTNGNADGTLGTLNVQSAGLRLSAGTYIGTTADELQIHVDTLTAVAAAGSVYVLDTVDETIGSVGVTVQQVGITGFAAPIVDGTQSGVTSGGANGNVVLQAATGNLTLASAVGASGSGNLLVQAQAGNVVVNATAGSATGNLSVLGASGVTVTQNIGTSGSGSVDVESGAGSVTMSGNTLLSSGSGAIRVLAAQSIALARMSTTGNVALTATAGSITDANSNSDSSGLGIVNVTANGLRLNASNALGSSTDALQLQVSITSAVAGAGGAWLIDEQADSIGSVAATIYKVAASGSAAAVTDATQGGFAVTGGGAVVLQTSTGNLSVDASVDANGGGNLLLQSMAGTLAINANVDSSATATGNGTGSMSLLGAAGVTFASGAVSVITGSGTLDVESGAAVTMGLGSLLQSTSGSIGVLGATSVAVAQVHTNQGVAITATAGNVTDADGNSNVNLPANGVDNVIASAIRLSASNGIGLGTDALHTHASDVTASAGAGGVYLMSSQSESISHATVVVKKVAQDGTILTLQTQPLQNGVTATGGGNVVLQATAGDITVSSSSTSLPAVVATGGGNVLVQSVAGAVNVNASIYSNAGSAGNGTGNVTVLGASGVNITLVGANPSIATGSGGIDVESGNGSVTMAASALVRDGSGPVRLAAAQNISVGKVTTVGNVSLAATTGAVTDANANLTTNSSATINVSAAGLAVSAGAGVGTPADALRTHVATLSAGATAGGVYAINDQAVTVGEVDLAVNQVNLAGGVGSTINTAQQRLFAGVTGNLVLEATAGDITLTDLTSSRVAVNANGSGNVLVQAAAGHVILNADVDGLTGNVTLLGNQGVSVGANVTTSGGVDVEAGAGSVTMATGTLLHSDLADVRVSAAQNIAVAMISTLHDVSLIATAGSITDADGGVGLNVRSDGLRINAGTGAGQGSDALRVDINTISESVGSGGGYVVADQSVVVGSVSATVNKTGLNGSTTVVTDAAQAGLVSSANGNLVLQASAGDVTLTSSAPLAAAVDADGAGNVLLQSLAGAVNVNGNVYSQNGSGTGDISVLGATGVKIGATGVVATVGTGGGTVDVESGAGSVTMSRHSVLASGGADVRVVAAGNIAVGEISSSTNVTLTAAGSIADANGNLDGVNGFTLDVQSPGLRLSAGTGAGTSTDALQTEVSTVAANIGSGGLFLVDDQALTVGSVATSIGQVGLDGNITTVADAAISGITAAVNGPVVLQATTGDVDVDAAISASGNANVLVRSVAGTVAVNANVVDGGTGAGSVSVIGASGVSLASNVAITDAASGASSLDVESSNGSVQMAAGSTLTGKSVRVIAAQNIGLGQVLSSGNVALTATAGSVTNATGASNNVSASGLYLSAGTSAGTSGQSLLTHVATLSAAVGNGGMSVVNDQGFSTGSVTTTIGQVGLDANLSTVTTATASDAVASAGSVTLEATAGDITLASAGPGVAAINANGSGNVLVESDTGSINVNANVLDGSVSTAGGISLLASQSVNIGSANGAVSIVDGAGAMDIEALHGNVVMSTASSLQASAGTVRVVGEGAVTLGVVQASGNTLAQAITGALTANANITAGAGTSAATLTLHSAHDLVVAAGVMVSDGAGAIAVTSDLGNVAMAASSLLQSASGPVNVVAAQAVAMGQVIATGATTLQAQGGTLTLASNVQDGTGTQPGALSLLATGDIVFAAGIAVSNGAGRVNIASSAGNIAMAASSTLQSSGGTLDLDAALGVTLGQVLAAANTRVQAHGGAIAVENAMTVGNGASGGSLSLLATGNIVVAAVDVSSGAGSIDLESSGGSVTMNPSAIVASGTGAVRVLAAQDVGVGMIATTGNVAISAVAGSIVNASNGLDVLANGLRLSAGNGIGQSAAPLEIQATTVTALAGAGGIALLSDQSVTVGSVAVSVNLVSATGTTSTVTDATQAGLVTGANGSISLQASSGDITLTPSGGIAVSANGSGNVLIQALADGGNVDAFAGIASGTGNIDVEAGNNIALYTPGSAAAQISTALPGLVTVHAINGTVISGGTTQPGQTVNLTTDQLTLQAPLVGTGNQLDIGPATVASNPDAVVVGGLASGGSGALYLSQQQIGLVQTGFKNVDIGSTMPGQAVVLVGQDASGNASANVFVNPLTLTASGAGGTIDISGALQSTTLDIEGSRTGTTLATAAVSTQGAMVVNDSVIVTGSSTLTSGTGAAANLTVNGSITGSGANNSLAMSANGGNVVVTGAVSGLDALTVTQAASVTFQSTLNVTGNVVINSTGVINFNGGVTIAAGGSLTINGASQVTFAAGADFTHAGNVAIATNVLNLNGGAGSIRGAGVLTLTAATAGGAIHVGSGTTAGMLNIGAQTVSAIGPGFQQLVLGTLDTSTGHASSGAGTVDITGSTSLTAFAAPLAVYASTITVDAGGTGVHVGGPLTLDAVGQISIGSDVTTTLAANVLLTSATSTVTMGAQTKMGSLGGNITLTTGNSSNATLSVLDSRATGSDVGAVVNLDVGHGRVIDVNADTTVNIYAAAVSMKGYGITDTAGSNQAGVLKVRAPIVYVAAPTGAVVADAGQDGRTNYNAFDQGTMYEELIAVGATTRVTLPADAVIGGGPEALAGQGVNTLDYSLMHAAASESFISRLLAPTPSSTDADSVSLTLGVASADDAAPSGYVLGSLSSHPSVSGVESYGDGTVDYWTEALVA